MPSQADIEAAAKTVGLTEAEAHWLASYLSPKSDESATAQGIKDKVDLAIGEARTQPREYYSPGNEPKREARTHTCHTDCPCQTGGEPRPDFLEGRTQPCEGCDRQGVITATLGGVHGLGEFKCPDCQPETGQSDDETKALIRISRTAYEAGQEDERCRIVALIEGLVHEPSGDANGDQSYGYGLGLGAALTAIKGDTDG